MISWLKNRFGKDAIIHPLSRSSASVGTMQFHPEVEKLEDRLVPASSPLHVSGNQLLNASNQVVVLRGVNLPGLEWRPDGDNLLQAENLAIQTWHVNLIRLPVNEDFWFGYDQSWTGANSGDGGAAYRSLVDQVIQTAEANNVYVMLDLHWSDMGTWGANNGQHFLPDDHSTAFWQNAAARYANNPAVLFDPYNEPAIGLSQPTAANFAEWRNGGTVTETSLTTGQVIGVYHSPGMQGLINTIRATGATNIIAPEGLDWGSDLTGVLTGYALSDPTGNLMYQSHLYPDKFANSAIVNSVTQVGLTHPIYIGEWGDGGTIGQPSQSALVSNQNMLAYLDQHNYSWTAWALSPDFGSLDLLSSWNGATTSDYGALVLADLASHAPAVKPAQPPTIATAASASPAVVTGLTTNLSVLGNDAGGAASLTYTWSTTSAPAAVAFSQNGTNAAHATTATFTRAGNYTFQVRVTDAAGLSVTSSVQVVVTQTLSSIQISPGSTTLTVGSSQQFQATALDQFGTALTSQPAFTWSVTGAGTITGAGLFKGASSPGTAVVTVKSGAFTTSSTVTVTAIPPRLQALAQFADTDDWGSGFTGSITIKNTGPTAINGWTLAFNFTGTITDIWSGEIVSHVGNQYVITSAAWNSTIAPGQSVSFGFNANWANPQTGPTQFTLNGVAIAQG